MNVSEIIKLIPERYIEELAIEHKSDKYAKKLQAGVMFKLLLHCILSYKDNSLRRMNSNFENIFFAYMNGKSETIVHSSISERLSTMNPIFFKSLYEKCTEIYGELLGHSKLLKVDSTIVGLSSSLLHTGFNLKGGDASKLNLIKYTIGITNIPIIADIYTELPYTNENKAMGESLRNYDKNKELIRVFDRGIFSREIYDELMDSKTPFVSRINPNCRYKKVETNTIVHFEEKTNIELYSDEIVYLYSVKSKTKNTFRLIKSRKTDNDGEIWFVTSITCLPTHEIADIYKKRWDIEVFFKFLKQELNFSHFINRSENGIEIILYSTLIAAILLLVYKKKNGLSGYKIMKQKFIQELEYELVKEIVIICGGDVEKMKHLKPKSPP